MTAVVPTPTDAMVPVPYRVTRRTSETADTVTIDLEAVDGQPFDFTPGQFNMLSAFGVGEAAISISGDPARHDRLTHTIRSVGAVTAALTSADSGTVIGVRGPYGTGWPLREAEGRDVVFIAGGIGMAPLRPAILDVLNRRSAYKQVWVVHGARSPLDLLYTEELHQWRARFDLDVEITVDHSDPTWRGDVGVVTRFLPSIIGETDDAVVMVCGPEIMMQVVADRLIQSSIDAADVHVSIERNMKCGIGHCGHCQYGPDFVCLEGPVFSYSQVESRMRVRGL